MLPRKAGKWAVNLLVMSFLISALLLQATVPASSQAQSAITSDGTMGTAVTYDTGSYTISAGTIRGTNQFHSFGMFNVPTAESATFTGPPTIENIIGRVTGGELSNIDGIISSTVEGANLFLLNPAGILFGPNASLDVRGSFHASTSEYLKLGDGNIFYADPAGHTMLTAASPAAFGFLGGNPAGISIQESTLEVPAGKTLSIVGGEVDIAGFARVASLLAPGGRINVASVGSAGEVIPNLPGDAADLNVDSFGSLGNIELTGAAVNAGGPGGGTVVIRGGQFMLSGSTVFASVTETGSGTVGEGVDIQVADNLVLDNTSQVGTNVFGGAADNSGGVRIMAGDLEIKNFSEVQSVAFLGSAGNSGDIVLTASNSASLENWAYLRTGTGGSGNSGNIVVETGALEVKDASKLFSHAFDGSGNSGNISVTADSILFSNARYPGSLTGISAQTGVFDYTTFVGKGTGSGGDVTVTANSLEMLGGTEISTPSFFSGQGGDITLNIDGDISIKGSESLQPFQTGIFANTFVLGQGGSLSLTADSLEMTSKTAIQTSTFGLPAAGAGNTLINVGRLELRDRSFISTSGSFGFGGSSGNLEINAETILISGPESSADPFGADFTGLSTVAGPNGGQGGDMHIAATDGLILTSRASISATSLGPGEGGNLNIETGMLQVLNGSNIIANAFGSGGGGTVDIQADTVRVSGIHPESYEDETGFTTLAVSGIASQAGDKGGSAGDVTIRADRVEVLDGGKLGVDVFGSGNGGNLEIVADSVLVSDVNAVLRDFLIGVGGNPKFAGSLVASGTDASRLGDDATGNGGRIRIEASDLRVQDGALISSETTTPGDGGNIELEADNVTLAGGGSISAVSRFSANAGKAGDISISANQTFSGDNSSVTTAAEQAEGGDISITSQQAHLANGSLISAESSGPGDAGDITINAADAFLMSDSSVTTEAEEAAGGNITIHTDYMVRLGDSLISASVRGGPDTVGGNITIDPEYVILRNSQIIAKAFEGRGGNIRIVAGIFLADQDSTVDASSEKGIDGTVEIRAPIKDVSRKVKPLPEKFTSAAVLLRESCIARMRGGTYSSFIVGGREGLPLEPGSLLPSPLLLQ